MDPRLALVVVVGVLVLAILAVVLARLLGGRTRHAPATSAGLTAADLGLTEEQDAFGTRATLVQFSTAICARCPATRRLLGAVAAEHPGVTHVDVDLTHRVDLARRFEVLQTPTLLVLDAERVPRARISGPPPRRAVLGELDRLLGGTHV